jgi:hypothetical protein
MKGSIKMANAMEKDDIQVGTNENCEISKVEESRCKCRIAYKTERLSEYLDSMTSVREDIINFSGNYAGLVTKIESVLTKIGHDGICTKNMQECLLRLSHMEVTKKELLGETEVLIARLEKLIEIEKISKEKADLHQFLISLAENSDKIFEILYPDKKI